MKLMVLSILIFGAATGWEGFQIHDILNPQPSTCIASDIKINSPAPELDYYPPEVP